MPADSSVMTDVDLTETDEAILEQLAEEGQSVPARIAEQIGKNRQYVYKRLKRMSEHEIVESLSHGLYRIKDDPRE